MSFFETYEQYLKYIELRLKRQSINALKDKFKNHILPFFKDYNIYEINENDILKFQIYINAKNLSFNSKRNIHFLLSAFFNYCIKFYNLNKNCCSIVGGFKRSNELPKKMDFYTLEEFNLFIRNVEEEIYKQFFNFMFYSGTRPGEAMALKFSDLQDNYVFISKTIDEHGKREISSPKTLSSYRKIIIDKVLKSDLDNLKKYYEEKYKNINCDYFIFGGIKPLAPTTINRKKIIACKKANIRPIRLHDFRHSHATLLLNNNIVITEISKRLGHNNISTTLNIYVHNNFEHEKRVFETLSNLRNDCTK